MLRRALPVLLLWSLSSLGCDRRSANDEPSTPAVNEPQTAPLRISNAVPAAASAVAVVQAHSTWLDTLIGADPLGPPEAAEVAELRKALDDFLTRETGIALTNVTMSTMFLIEKGNGFAFAAIVEGAEANFKTPTASAHQGVDIHPVSESTLVAAKIGSDVVIGDVRAVRAAIDAYGEHTPRFADASEMGPKLLEMAGNASAGIAVDLSAVRQWTEGNGLPNLDRAFMTLGSAGLHAVVQGDPKAISETAKMLEQGLAVALGQADRLEAQATQQGQLAEGALAIVAHYYARRLAEHLTPKVDGGTMTLRLPIRSGDPALIAALLGITSAIAIPAMSKYKTRSKTSEARIQIAKMFDSASAYFIQEQLREDAEAALGALHQCPNNGDVSGEAGTTPPLVLNCNEGPGGRCVPTSSTTPGAGYYARDLWTKNPVWESLNFEQEQAHYFHYNFKYTNGTTGYGTCQFTAQAFADLDNDGVFSTYERAGSMNEHGVNAAAGLYIDREME